MPVNEPNRLADELSPYLVQHAHNPVDWYPWGEEALEKSRADDKPILLSIGYSACHWCHVMERESFEDEATAKLMNELFVSVKVDREERPDLDQIYQTTVQLMGRGGGWPLTVFLTPTLKPFYAGTYFPPVDRHGMPSFQTVLRAVHEAWASRRADVERSAGELTRAIGEVTAGTRDPGDAPKDLLGRVTRKLASRIDERHGGFGGAPKFPNTMCLEVLLRAHHESGDADALRWVTGALDGMRDGGICDQLGGGFHRYSVDERWLVPHFEKMLYDNALLTSLYLDAWRATGEARFETTVRETLAYVLREMRSPEGAFYSSQDADSEGEEGKFFVFTPEEVTKALGAEDAAVASVHYGVAPGGNFEGGATVLHVSRPIATVARQLGREERDVAEALARARAKLFEVRAKRIAPFRDEKIIAAWNGLAISAFARAGGALGERSFVDAATRALAFVRERMVIDGVLHRISKDGTTRVPAFLEDWGDLACAACDVYEATFDGAALTFAKELVDGALARFDDAASGAFFFTEAGRADLVVRARDAYDNAVPSGASAMLHALLRVHALTGDETRLARAERAVRAVAPLALETPFGFGHAICALDRWLRGSTTVVIVGAADDAGTIALASAARRAFEPNLALALVRADGGDEGPAALLEGRRTKDGRATAYVCRGRTCSAPVVEPDALAALLGSRSVTV